MELHHVIPVAFGGQGVLSNLVSLCAGCHKAAPNEPSGFFRWAASGLPPSMDISKHLTKVCVSILFHRERLGEKVSEAEELVDRIYPDLWKVFRGARAEEDTSGLEALSEFASKYFAPPERGSS